MPAVMTAGVDLATERQRTALATIRWTPVSARVETLSINVDDAAIVGTAERVSGLGLDCPLGWPDEFLRFLQTHHNGHAVAPEDVAGLDWRRRLAYRATDRAVHESCGLTPLSVAADRIGLTAMRAAGLLAELAARGQPVDRAGGGVVVEVYPAASLKIWGLPYKQYKRKENRPALEALRNALLAAAPWLDLGGHEALCGQSDDAFDAVIAAMTARAKALGQTTMPANRSELEQARREGWIALPTKPISFLLERQSDRATPAAERRLSEP